MRFENKGGQRGDSRRDSFRRGPPRGGFRGPREMHKATCSDCGKETEVPFKPTEGKPVYCKDCYMKRKDSSFNQE